MSRSWVEVPDGSDFTFANLAYGVIRPIGMPPRCGVRIGDQVLDLAAVQQLGLLDGTGLLGTELSEPALNGLLAAGPTVWAAVRGRLVELLGESSHWRHVLARHLYPVAQVKQLLPFDVADYVDFYSSEHHARNMGLILRPDSEPLLANWKHLPVGYHGRSGTVVVSGTPVRRPQGLLGTMGKEPTFAPTAALDIELEVGAVIGGPPGATTIPVDEADEHVFGFVLLNDWSARDIQAFEYQPLGPFLGKSFATSISAWVVSLAALTPGLVPGPAQDPPPAGYLRGRRPWGLDVHLEVALNGITVSRTNLRHLYWTFAQQLAHVTANGATTRPGDLLGSGTVSGPEPGSYGSLMELTWRGRDPLSLPGGAQRNFLEDGDRVELRGWCGEGESRVGFGECAGTIVPAQEV